MPINVDEAKRAMRRYLQRGKTVQTPMGALTIAHQLGEGANSIVFSANTSRNKPLAFKVLAEDCSTGETERYSRFLTELREIVQLSDTGLVVSIYSWGFLEIETGRFPYAVQKQYPQTLSQWRRDNAINSLDELMPIVQDLLNCLEAIHRLNIVHRDLKPQNLFITEQDHIVLADFGIAWFDPTHYDRLAQTSPSERLANFAFSAPEQFERNSSPAPTMDLYALGQLIQWLVTGETHRGVGRRLLSSVHASLGPIDPIIDQLLQHDPQSRPQSIGDVRLLVEDSLLKSSEQKWTKTMWAALDQFDDLLARVFPGARGLVEVRDQATINRFLTELADEVSKYPIWMVKGQLTAKIDEMRSLDDDKWLIHSIECDIQAIWVNRVNHAWYRDYVLIECAPRQPFGTVSPMGGWDEAAWFVDRYISREEYDDGYAQIDGETVRLQGRAESRVRETNRSFWFLGPIGSNIVQFKNRNTVEVVVNLLAESEKVDFACLALLEDLEINDDILWSR